MSNRKRTGAIGMSAEVREARKSCIGGSDARIIMSGDQLAIEQLWAEKRGDRAATDLSDVLLVQMGNITEDLNLDWFELTNPGFVVTDEQARLAYSQWPVAMSTLDGKVRDIETNSAHAIIEAKFMLPFGWSMEKAVEKYYAQLQHNMMVTGLTMAKLSVITGAGLYACHDVPADEFWQAGLLDAERAFWDCVQTGKMPGSPTLDAPDLGPPIKIVDMTGSNEWASFAADMIETAEAVGKHETAKKRLKAMLPADAAEAIGHGMRLHRSKDNKILFDFAKPKKASSKKAA